AINTSSVQLIPVTAIAILAANRSSNPTAIVGTSILATACAAISAVAVSKLLSHLPIFRLPPAPVVSPCPPAPRTLWGPEETAGMPSKGLAAEGERRTPTEAADEK